MPIVVCAVLTAAGATPSAVILAKTAKINKGNKEKENQEEKEEKTHAVNTLYMAGINLIFMMLTHRSDELQNLIVLAGAVISVGFAIDTILLFLFNEELGNSSPDFNQGRNCLFLFLLDTVFVHKKYIFRL